MCASRRSAIASRWLYSIPILLIILACAGTAPTVSPVPPSAPTGTLATGAPAPTGTLASGDTTRSLVHDGIERTYLLHIPPGYDATRPTPLVLAFHGFELDGGEMARISGLNEQADLSGFIVAYPNGTGAKSSWNGGHCCGEAAKNNVDDVGFVRALIDELSALTSIDPARVYATGFSNGAIFVYRLACEASDRIAAFAPVSATPVRDDQQVCQPSRSVPLIYFHGTADRLNPYQGGTTGAGFEYVTVPEAIQFWVERNACPESPQSVTSGNIQHDVYAPCAQGTAVELYTIMDGEHAWPGGEAVNERVGEPTMEISATPLIWEFFAAHPMP